MPRILALVLLAGCNLVFGADAPDGGLADDGATPGGCWDAAVGGDEDTDDREDGCDPCPADADAVDAVRDIDGDGVGDACDPDSGVQKWVVFDGFHTTESSWQAKLGVWGVANGAYGSTVPVASGQANRPIPGTLHPGIESVITDLDGTSPTAAAGLEIAFGAFAVARCSYVYASGSDRLVLEVTGQSQQTEPFDAPGAVRIRMYQDTNNRMHCVAFAASAQSEELRSSELQADTSTQIGVFAQSTPASFRWVGVTGRR